MKAKMNTGRDAVALALAHAYETAANTGSKIAEVCTIARTTYKGAEIPEADVEHIVSKVAESRGWEGATLKVRSSEARKVLGVYSTLPEGIEQVRAKRGACDWRSALKVATCLKKHDGKLKPAMAAFLTGSENDPVSPSGRAASALKRWYKVAKGDKKAKIIEAAELLGLKLGVTTTH
jgi:hypothetical protein